MTLVHNDEVEKILFEQGCKAADNVVLGVLALIILTVGQLLI
ncbi:hypothetical protein SDC9_115202 [bioreactor metagenome]|uniref:Uncharacterized protein n=1 Tax=bioreactor metagenome TaxID=1076179 RepID=A0A645BUH3_9ZZZZ